MALGKDPMTIMEAINGRRSVRSYASQSLDATTVRALLAAAVQAPTAVHEEPWRFVVIQDRSALRRLSDRAKPLFLEEVQRAHLDRGGHTLDIFASPGFDIFYDAGTLVVIGAQAGGPFAAADCWLAAENLMLAAYSMGLGTCVIGSALAALNLVDTKAELGIPPEFSAIAPIIVGVPRGETPLTSRKEPRILVWK
jgi:nitroreductase